MSLNFNAVVLVRLTGIAKKGDLVFFLLFPWKQAKFWKKVFPISFSIFFSHYLLLVHSDSWYLLPVLSAPCRIPVRSILSSRVFTVPNFLAPLPKSKLYSFPHSFPLGIMRKTICLSPQGLPLGIIRKEFVWIFCQWPSFFGLRLFTLLKENVTWS